MNDRSPEFRQGAQAALEAMRHLSRHLQEHKAGESEAEYVARDELGVELMIDAAGPVTPYAAGFIAACAQYLIFSEDVGLPDVDVWVPDAALTEAEIQLRRAEMYSPPPPLSNVIPLRRPGQQ